MGEGPGWHDAPATATLLEVGLQVVDAHADALEVAAGLVESLLGPGDLQQHPPGGLADVRPADVRHHVEALRQRVDDRLLDERLGERELEPLPFQGRRLLPRGAYTSPHATAPAALWDPTCGAVVLPRRRGGTERDPAARSLAEVLLCYPGLHALWMHRAAHSLYERDLRLPARLVSQASRFMTGIEIHPGAQIGRRLFIDHGMGVVIGETTEIGDDVPIYQGVTLGGTGKGDAASATRRCGDGVIVGTGAHVLGPIVIGEGAKVGAGSIVIKDVPANSTVVGNPGRPVIVHGQRAPRDVHQPDIEHTRLPDPVAEALACLVRRVGELEREVKDLRAGRAPEPRATTTTRTASRRCRRRSPPSSASTRGPGSSRAGYPDPGG